jgi:hypothetical protein
MLRMFPGAGLNTAPFITELLGVVRKEAFDSRLEGENGGPLHDAGHGTNDEGVCAGGQKIDGSWHGMSACSVAYRWLKVVERATPQVLSIAVKS